MKYIKKFNESLHEDPIYIDIMDNFTFINDKLGEPRVSNKKFGNLKKWIVEWNLGINITDFNDADIIVKKLKSVIEEFDDILSAKDRMPEFNIQMSIKSSLIIYLTPKEIGDDNYKFIIKQEWRNVHIDMEEVERFFNKGGINILEIYNAEEEEMDDGISLRIKLNEINDELMDRFILMFNDEISNRKDINREVEVYKRREFISIVPISEKTNVVYL